VVICDRFHDATLAYQHYGRGLDLSALEALIAQEIETTPPSLTFWLDLDVDQARERILRRTAEAKRMRASAEGAARPDPEQEGRLEQEDARFHLRVRGGYEALAEKHPERIVRIDAGGHVDAVRDRIWDVLVRRYHVL
jgi:dTMP kinase